MEAKKELSIPVKPSLRYLYTFIRILTGWHFLYEGIIKLFSPTWSSSAYLLESTWIFSGFFKALANNPSLLSIVDFLNTWGLILIGLGMFFGLLTRISAWSGACLLFLYYISHPPFMGLMNGTETEGNYLFVNKNLIELFVFVLLAKIPVQWMFGIDNLLLKRKTVKTNVAPLTSSQENKREAGVINESPGLNRRTVIKNLIQIPLFGGFLYAVFRKYMYENMTLDPLLEERSDAVSSASTKFKTFATLSELKEEVPAGKIGNLRVSRLICGGNLLSGIAHSRDLIYVDNLMKQYFTSEKVIQTFRISESCGINTALVRTDTNTVQLFHKYWKMGGKIQWLAQTKTTAKDKEVTINAQIALDNGASAIYIQGNNADTWVNEGRFDHFDKWFAQFQGKGAPLGVGAHELDVIKAMEEKGYPVDFYMKTIHDTNYWSFQPDEPKDRVNSNRYDNYWCREPEETIKFMESVKKPWIGFKILAAGAIKPDYAFRYALENGCDFVCVGMFDFQVVEDSNILTATLKNINDRKRAFYS